jgi:hypothetical protein
VAASTPSTGPGRPPTRSPRTAKLAAITNGWPGRPDSYASEMYGPSVRRAPVYQSRKANLAPSGVVLVDRRARSRPRASVRNAALISARDSLSRPRMPSTATRPEASRRPESSAPMAVTRLA